MPAGQRKPILAALEDQQNDEAGRSKARHGEADATLKAVRDEAQTVSGQEQTGCKKPSADSLTAAAAPQLAPELQAALSSVVDETLKLLPENDAIKLLSDALAARSSVSCSR